MNRREYPQRPRPRRSILINIRHHNLVSTHASPLDIQPILHRPQPLPHNQCQRSRHQRPALQRFRHKISPNPPSLITLPKNITRRNGPHAHTLRDPLARGPPHRHDERFALTALRDTRTSAHSVVVARGVVDARQRGAAQGADGEVLDVFAVVIEDEACAEAAAVRSVVVAGDGEDCGAGSARELDCCRADAGGAAPDEDDAVEGLGGRGAWVWVGEGKVQIVALVEACGCGGDGEGEDCGVFWWEGGWVGGGGEARDDGVLLESAVGRVVGREAVGVAVGVRLAIKESSHETMFFMRVARIPSRSSVTYFIRLVSPLRRTINRPC